MRYFVLVLCMVLILVSVVFGIRSVQPQQEAPTIPVTEETLPPVTEQTVPIRTEATIPPETTVPAVEEAAETKIVDSVPLYYQTDYPYIPFGNGTIATSGCSITCLAMVATYLTDREYTPVQMAWHFGDYGKNNIERLDYGIAQMQLPCRRSGNIQEVTQALKEGKVVIAMMDAESVFTTEQHFVVFAGVNEAGKYVVNDPMEPNYTTADPHIREAYDNGFEYYHLSRGFSGAWIFDKEEMEEELSPFDASVPEQQENRYEGYLLTGDDIYMLACFVHAEAAQEPAEVQQAVAEVVLNRVMSADYPNTVRDVIYQTEFYRAAEAMKRMEEPAQEAYIAVDTVMFGPYVLPEDICFFSAWEQGKEVWGKLGSFTFAKRR